MVNTIKKIFAALVYLLELEAKRSDARWLSAEQRITASHDEQHRDVTRIVQEHLALRNHLNNYADEHSNKAAAARNLAGKIKSLV
ncbi:hypothetical protein Pori2_00011 [Pseudomonas phage vB_PpuP-Pori-2]